MILDFLKTFEWENEAFDISFLDKGVKITADKNTDFWLDKSQKIFKKNASFFYTTKIGNFEIKASFDPKEFDNFSQCGLMIKANDQNAFKVSLMSADVNNPQIGTSHSSMGFSDWAIYPLDKVEKTIFYKIVKKDNIFVAYYSFNDVNYHKIRQFSFVEPIIELMIGAYFASPSNKEYTCVLKNIEIK